jgi:signal transduction histidine kinase
MSIDFTIAPPGKPEKHLFATMETICENRKKINTRLWIFRDITTRRNAEKDKEKLLAALEKKNKELESILYIASHDLRSPLVNAQGFGSLLEIIKGELRSKLEETAMNEDDRSVMLTILDERISMPIRFINSSCLKMDSLIQGLLSLSRTGIIPMEVSKLDMNIMLEGIVQTLTIQIHRADATLEVESLPSCTGDEMQINQLFTNLIDNAIKYRDTNRKLTINVSGTTEGTMSVYKVSDTGKGIPDYQLEKIWKLFHRCDPQGEVTGEGLGLTIAKRIAERQGGSITAESQPDRGTTFIISIPTNIAAQ